MSQNRAQKEKIRAQKKLFLSILDTLTPHFQDVGFRDVIVFEAFFGTVLTERIQLDGAARHFTNRLIKTLLLYGELEEDLLAIVVLLDTASKYVGPDNAAELKTLSEKCRYLFKQEKIETSQQITLPEDKPKTRELPTITCRVCDTQNPSNVEKCINCETPLAQYHKLDVNFDQNRQTLVLKPDNCPAYYLLFDDDNQSEYQLGRGNSNTEALSNFIDLVRCRAMDKGVSREHALIRYNEDAKAVEIIDVGSSHGTLVNTRRLTPQKPKVLRDGDRIQLGLLSIAISFANVARK